MRRFILFAMGLLMMPLGVFAQQPSSTQRIKPNRPVVPMKKPVTRPATDPEEFNAALAFLEKVSPNRAKAYQSLDDERKGIFRDRIVAYYRVNQWIDRDDNNEMRKVRQNVIKAEDDVFGVRWDILAAGGPRRASDEQRARLRAAVAELVKLQLAEREERLEAWRKWVKGEEDQLAAIEKNPDAYIDQRYRDEMEGRGLGLFDHPRRPPGAPNPPGGQKGNEKGQPAK